MLFRSLVATSGSGHCPMSRAVAAGVCVCGRPTFLPTSGPGGAWGCGARASPHVTPRPAGLRWGGVRAFGPQGAGAHWAPTPLCRRAGRPEPGPALGLWGHRAVCGLQKELHGHGCHWGRPPPPRRTRGVKSVPRLPRHAPAWPCLCGEHTRRGVEGAAGGLHRDRGVGGARRGLVRDELPAPVASTCPGGCPTPELPAQPVPLRPGLRRRTLLLVTRSPWP